MNRYSFYIDGTNLYHVIEQSHPGLQWLDLSRMAKSVIPRSSMLENVFYFSTVSESSSRASQPHKIYIRALKNKGVRVVLGRLKRKLGRCRSCGARYVYHGEKQTDVNMALRVFEDAMMDAFDCAVILSGDTDFLPVLRSMKKLFPEKRIGVMLPIGAHAEVLKVEADFHIKMKSRHLKNNQFPEELHTPKGPIRIPDGWEMK